MEIYVKDMKEGNFPKFGGGDQCKELKNKFLENSEYIRFTIDRKTHLIYES